MTPINQEVDQSSDGLLAEVEASTVFKNLSDCVEQGKAIEPNMFAYQGLRDLLAALSRPSLEPTLGSHTEGVGADPALAASAVEPAPRLAPPGCDQGERFTPGPWTIEAGANSHFFDMRIVADTECIAFVDGDIIESDDGDDPTIEPSANARLIATAPDGYALAKWIERNYATHQSHEDFRVAAFGMALDYLAKVRGEA